MMGSAMRSNWRDAVRLFALAHEREGGRGGRTQTDDDVTCVTKLEEVVTLYSLTRQ